jgi:hypothetical protein
MDKPSLLIDETSMKMLFTLLEWEGNYFIAVIVHSIFDRKATR